MPKSTDIRLRDVRTSFTQIDFRSPIKFGGRVVSDMLRMDVEVDVETLAGARATGYGSMPLGNVWAWPSQTTTAAATLEAMRQFGDRAAGRAANHREPGHPLEITRRLAKEHAFLAEELVRQGIVVRPRASDQPSLSNDMVSLQNLAEPMPELAQLVATSPIEAAIHDGYGRAHGANSYNLLGREFVNRDLAAYLGREFEGEFLDQYTLRTPKPTMPLYHLVGALDPIFPADVVKPLGDGLPESLGEWITYNGLTHLKIKLNGDDLAWDVARVLAVEQAAAAAQAARGCTEWHYSVDFNEKCESVQYVLDFLTQIKARSPAAFNRIQYIEQPTHRDLRAHPENRMHAAAKIKPVVIDESLIDYESLLLAREQGYSGVALKACKGHTEALLMGAAAQKHKLFLCVQDLCCVGYSFLHSASLAARIPTIAAIEGNGRQYCPEGNREWDKKFPTMFHITNGTVGTAALTGNGLGF